MGTNLPETIHPSKALGKELFTGYNRLQTAALASNADYFISAGGSTFSKHSKYSLKEVALHTGRKANKKLKLGAIGVSVGPFRSVKDEKETVRYLKEINFLTLRDRRSYDYATSLDLPYKPIEAFDLAALLPEVYHDIDIIKKEMNNKKLLV